MAEKEKKPGALPQLKERLVSLRQAQMQDQAGVMAMTEELTARDKALEDIRRRIDRRSGAIQQLNQVLEILEAQKEEPKPPNDEGEEEPEDDET